MISIGNLQINKLCLGDVEVTKAYLGDVQVYGSNKKYMTLTVLDGDAGTTITPTITGTLSPNLQYRVNNGKWNDYVFGQTGDIHASVGDVIQWKGVNESGLSTSSSNYLNFGISGNPVALSGNVMSLIDGVGDALNIPCDYCFYRLFHGSSIKTISPDFLPATTITNGCYFDLFSGSLLENSPELPALTMKENCYRGMFYGCQHFTQTPELPATTLANDCYAYMLAECSSLVQVPALHATKLATECYRGLFQNCTSITQAPALPATTLANYCYQNMFSGCTALATAPEILPATTLLSNCYRSMFYNCTSLTQAPALHATTLADWCCAFMFYGCTSLTQAPALPATELAQYCYNQMFLGCTSLTKAPELPATTLVAYCYQFMFYNCSNLSYVKSLATNITATNAIYQWLNNVAATGTFVKPYGVGYQTGISGIPEGWSVVNIDEPTQEKYMTITVLDGDAGTTISPQITGTLTPNLQYRVNNGSWSDFIVGTTADIHAVAGDVVQFKGVNESGISTSSSNYMKFAISGNPVSLSGNIMSLIDGVGDALVIPNDYCFCKLFRNSVIKTVSSDFLPATELTPYCYQGMFINCTALEIAPELPATIVKNYCYSSMFDGCTSLVSAPELPATTLASNCYAFMFDGCTSLVSAPELPATTLTNSCYSYMFCDCTALTQASALPATTLDDYCYEDMFRGCTGLVTAPELPATTLAYFCYSNMFSDCKSLENAPVLPATTLVDSCYMQMFEGCSKLNYVKSMATEGTINDGGTVPSALQNWLGWVSSTGIFEKPSAAVYVTDSIGGIPKGWTVKNI